MHQPTCTSSSTGRAHREFIHVPFIVPPRFTNRHAHRYAHILSYLRSPESKPGAPACLPHGARLNGSCVRMEALLELRDEASYLGLDDLQQLCDDELAGQVPLVASTDAKQASDNKSEHSTHTLIDGTAYDAKEKSSPALQTVDIPIVLPVHEPRRAQARVGAGTKTYSAESNASVGSQASTASKRERRAGQVDMLPKTGIVNASRLREQSLERQRALAKPPGNYF